MKRHVLAALFALCVLTALLPATATALNTGAIQMGANGIKDPDGNESPTVYNYIYFGKNGESPVKWRVLDADETNTGDLSGSGMFLLSEERITNSEYTFSTIQSQLQQLQTLNKYFSDPEGNCILPAKDISNVTDGDKLFPLSKEEVESSLKSYFPNKTNDLDKDYSWWLRTPYETNGGYYVDSDGEIASGGSDFIAYLHPAFNLNRSEVLMISAAEGGKPGDVSSTLDEINTYTPTEWKLTLKGNDDGDGIPFTPLSVSASGNELTIEYICATTGPNEYISAIVEKSGDYDITHYGRILSLAKGQEKGTVTVTLPDDMRGKTLSLFNEQYNGDKMTDYASSLSYIDYCAIDADCAQLDFGRAFKGETLPAAQTVTIRSICNESVTIKLPESENYTISAIRGFDGDSATLAQYGDFARFTVRPKNGFGVGKHNDTITVSCENSRNPAIAEISVTFLVDELKPVDAIQFGTGAIHDPISDAAPSAYSYIYFGKNVNGKPNKWRVLDKNKTNSHANGMFLLSEEFITNSTYTFNESAYQSSGLPNVLKNIADNDEIFSTTERYNIIGTTIGSGGGEYLDDDRLFPLSWNEATSLDYFPNGDSDREKSDNWWLRTPNGANGGYCVTPTGNIADLDGAEAHLRPAMSLDARDILFTSSANGGKEAAGMGVDPMAVAKSLTAVGKEKTDSWKLTLKDRDLNLQISFGSTEGNVLTVPYSKATTGPNKYISAIIIDDVSGNITHYGRILSLSDGPKEGKVTITLPEDMTNKLLYMFNERYNGEKMTDYVSDLNYGRVDYFAIKATADPTLDFGAAYTGYNQPAARTVTINGIRGGAITVNLPTLENFTIIAGKGFSEGEGGVTAPLAKNDTATFTIQPNAGLGVGTYGGKLTVEGSVFDGGISINDTLDVTFAVKSTPYYTVAAEPNDASYGSVTGGGTYRKNSAVTLTAAENDGYHFVKWTENGEDVDTANPLTFSATTDRTLTALFEASANPPASENAIAGVTAGQEYVKGDEATFTAQGGGMENDSPYQNDMRWLPISWKIGVSGNFDGGYTQSFSTADMDLGSHTLSVEFSKQRFRDGVWENVEPAQTDTKTADFAVIAAPPSAFGLETLALKPDHNFDLNRLTGQSEGSWSISEPIADINAKNRLIPKKRGSAELIFTHADGRRQRVTLHVVKPAEEVNKVAPEVKKYVIAVGDTLVPQASVKPKNASYPQLLWTAENPEMLKNAGEGEFKALSVGKTVLLATATSGKTAEIKVIITDTPQSITLDRKKAALKKDETLTLTLKSYLPATLPAPTLTWTSSNEKVATVDENGTVRALKKGKTTITAKANGEAKAKVKITVK